MASASTRSYSPISSFIFSKLVVPTIGAVMKSFDNDHASATCAIVTPFFLDSSSTRSLICLSASSGLSCPRALNALSPSAHESTAADPHHMEVQ